MRMTKRTPRFLAALVTTVLGAGCSTGGVNGPSYSVSVIDNAFTPKQLTVPVGQNVSWVWSGTQPHDVVFNDGPSSEVQTNGQFDRSFPTAGTFSYICSLHSGMNGTIIVQ